MSTFDKKTVNGDCKRTCTASVGDPEAVTMTTNQILESATAAKCTTVAIETGHESENDLLSREEVEKGIKQELCVSSELNKADALHETKAEDKSRKGISEHCDKVLHTADVDFVEQSLPVVQSLGKTNDSQINEQFSLKENSSVLVTELKHSDSCLDERSGESDFSLVSFSDLKIVHTDDQEVDSILDLTTEIVSIKHETSQDSDLSKSSLMFTVPSFTKQSTVMKPGTYEEAHNSVMPVSLYKDTDSSLSKKMQGCLLPTDSCQEMEDTTWNENYPSSLDQASDKCDSVLSPIILSQEIDEYALKDSSRNTFSTLQISSTHEKELNNRSSSLSPMAIADKKVSSATEMIGIENSSAHSKKQVETEDKIKGQTASLGENHCTTLPTRVRQELQPQLELKLAKEQCCKISNEKTDKLMQKAGASLPGSTEKVLSDDHETSDFANKNVNTEHTDFEVARNQWLMLEMTNKSQKPCPHIRQQLLQNNQEPTTSMCKKCPRKGAEVPERGQKSMESSYLSSQLVTGNSKENQRQAKKVSIEKTGSLTNPPDSVTLQEGLATQEQFVVKNLQERDISLKALSPCSDDSGVGDSSCKSPYDDSSATRKYIKNPSIYSSHDRILSNMSSDCLADASTISSLCVSPVSSTKTETPIEKEIRQSLEREENLRQARGISKSSSSDEYVKIKASPSHSSSAPVSPKGKPKQLAEMQMQRDILIESQREAELVQQRKMAGMGDKGITKETEECKILEVPKDKCSLPNSPDKQVSPWVANPSVLTSLSMNASLSPWQGSSYCEMTADHVIILENDVLIPSRQTGGASAASSPSEWLTETANLIILETPNIVIHSAVDNTFFPISKMEPKRTIQNNPFFQLRSSGSPIIDQEMKEAQEREEELRRQRDNLYGKVSLPNTAANLMDTATDGTAGTVTSSRYSDCKGNQMRRSKSALDQHCSISEQSGLAKEAASGLRHKSAVALRWEAGIFANHQDECGQQKK